jgi:hypothetical protein
MQDFHDTHKFPDLSYVNGSKELTHPSKAMIMCFEQLTKAVFNLTLEVKRIADNLEKSNQ